MTNPIVYDLIHSLSKNEKGFFVKSLSKKESVYLKLYYLMLKQKKYNEGAILKSIGNSYVIKNYNVAKSYLYQLILKSLTNYNASKKESYYLFHVIDILYRKGLYKNCAKMIKQVVKKADDNQDYLAKLRAIEYVKYLKYSSIEFDEVIESLLENEEEIILKQQLLSKLQSLLFQIKKVWNKTGAMKKQDSVVIANDIISYLSKMNVQDFDGRKFHQMYHETFFLCGLVLQDDELTKKHFAPLKHIITEEKDSKQRYDYQIVDILNQLLRYNLFKEKYDEAVALIAQLRSVVDESTVINRLDKIAITTDCFIFEMHVLVQERKLEEMNLFITEVKNFVARNRGDIPSKFFLLYKSNLLVMYFILGEYRKVSGLSNEILSNKSLDIRNDIITSVMLIELVVFYELQKYSLFESRLLAFDNYLKRNEIKAEVWKIFSELLHNFSKVTNEKIALEIFLTKIEKQKGDQVVSDLDFLIEWAEKRSSS